MPNRWLILLLVLCTSWLPLVGQAQTRPLLSGRVVNGARQPLAGVSVLVQGTALGTSTNADGLFVLEALPPGPHTLRFDLSGFVITDVAISYTTRPPLLVKLVSTRPPSRARGRHP